MEVIGEGMCDIEAAEIGNGGKEYVRLDVAANDTFVGDTDEEGTMEEDIMSAGVKTITKELLRFTM